MGASCCRTTFRRGNCYYRRDTLTCRASVPLQSLGKQYYWKRRLSSAAAVPRVASLDRCLGLGGVVSPVCDGLAGLRALQSALPIHAHTQAGISVLEACRAWENSKSQLSCVNKCSSRAPCLWGARTNAPALLSQQEIGEACHVLRRENPRRLVENPLQTGKTYAGVGASSCGRVMGDRQTIGG